MAKTIAAYGGGFKPPTKGHLEVVKRALESNPDIDEFIIYVGGKERDGIGQTESLLIWDIFKKYLPMKVKIEPSTSPIGDIVRLGKNNPDDKIYFVIGGREGRQDDLDDIANRTKNIEQTYPNMEVKVQVTPDEGMSGTNARKAAKVSSDKLSPFLPDELTDEEKEEVFNIIRPIVKEDYFGLNQFAREVAEGVLNEGKYDSLVTKLAGYTLNAWKGDFEDGQPKGYFELEVGPGKEFDYPHLMFKYIAKASFVDYFKSGGVARPKKKMPEVELNYFIPSDELPRMWEQIAGNIRNVIRHEIEHLMQSGPNVKKGKEMGDDSSEREELRTGKKPWWKIWRKTLGTPDYYKLEKEIDANLQGLYLKAKKTRQPLEKIIDIYLQYDLNLPIEDREDIKALWKERAPKLNIPLEENLNEEITKSQLDSIEAYADKLFAKLGIDIEFTKHFLDRVNDERNKKPITIPELIGMFKRLHKKHGKPLSKVDDDFDAVVKDFNNNINIPFAINVTPNDIDLVAKTVMRKKDFKTSTPVIALNENASYQKDINLIEKLATLTQHMLDKGMNIEPLPNLEFVNGDSKNARDFFGKTAYYDPTSQTIVLYTEGRHPKDIARSYTHEMIHHIQNLEGRLGNITTTNTTEDDELDQIEREAYLNGNMTFRNWTDSLNEIQTPAKEEDVNPKELKMGIEVEMEHTDSQVKAKVIALQHLAEDPKYYTKLKSLGLEEKKNKDPFGLNQFAREIAEGVLNEGRYDKFTNEISKIVFEAFKDIHDRGDKEGEFEFSVGPDDEDIFSDQFEFDLAGVVEITDDEYVVDGGANAGFDNKGEEITPLLSVKFKIPKNPNWQEVSFDIKDVVRHELEHLTQDGLNVVPGKQMGDDEILRQMIDMDLLPKADYFKLAKEVDAMLQGLYFKAKKSKQPFGVVINDYLDKVGLDDSEKESVLKIWRNRRKALSLPLLENELGMDYKIFSDMDGVITDFNNRYKKYAGMMPAEYEKKFGKDKFWELADAEGVAFWVGMPWMEDGKQYWDYIKKYDVELLSSPSRSETSRLGKRLWVRNNLPGIKLTLAQAYNKQNYAAPNHILIDDRESNIDEWRSKGGIGILHTSAADTIQQLKDLGL